ncbi:MAG: gliding motility-associated C-terminal domain-containing protein [Bacteroidia bacterium]|nr:gliding motility-associated C-terminal domain-containing protein [Bacteroidia bacterium]
MTFSRFIFPLHRISFLVFFFVFGSLQSQNENKKWYFGANAGLDFMTNPPTVVTGAMTSPEGCSAISDGAGNLLFYTNGINAWNANHSAMPAPGAMLGHPSACQSGVIVKQPGNNNIYFVFSNSANFGGGTIGLRYSIVDMSLAAGLGSITAINIPLVTPTTEQVTSVKHANGIDVWVLTRLYNVSTYLAYLVTAAGVNTVPVVSNVTANYSNQVGSIKLSPDGTKVAAGCSSSILDIYDFSTTTGQLSNHMALPLSAGGNAVWVEFSPNASKVYCGAWSGFKFHQFDLCAGSATAIAASQYTWNSTNGFGCMQLATNGKIYVAHSGQNFLGVIDNPNAPGAGCNYINNGQSISPNLSTQGLPNFITSGFIPPVMQFTTTIGTMSNGISCMSASFTSPPQQTVAAVGCFAFSGTLTSMLWNFGDPGSGPSNTTTVAHPIHQFSGLGTYTVSLILNYNNGTYIDTIQNAVNITLSCISVNSTSITCANLGSATVTAIGGVGPFSYTWQPTAQTNSVASGLSPGLYTITVHDFGNNYTYSATTLFTSLIPLTGSLSYASSLTCHGAATGTANYSNIAGGSGNQSYLWTNGILSYTTPNPGNLSSGLWNATVTDALTGCTINDMFIITQPFAQNPVIVASSPTTCAGTSITFTASNSGGTPGPGPAYNFTWTNGPSTNTFTASEVTAGSYIYTVQSSDGNNCVVSQTILVDYIQNPTLSVSNTSICPLETGTLSVSGASSYTWQALTPLSLTGASYTDNPLVNTEYTVVGSALSCTSSATASIILKPVPNPLFQSNSPVCQNSNVLFSVSTGTAFQWSGVNGFVSVTQSNTLSVSHPTQSGVYQVTVTAANSCTAAAQGTLTIHPTPSVSANGATVCVSQTLNLSAGSVPGAGFLWAGPNSFVSFSQNPSLANPVVNASGNYTVVATSPQGCSNTAVAHSTVTAMPVVSFTSNSPQCFGKTLTFNAGASSGALNYSWSGPNGFTSTAISPFIPNVTVPASGTYTLTLTTGPCVISLAQTATVHPLPLPVPFNSAPVCEGKSFQLGVNNSGVTYTWTGPNAYNSNQQNITIASAQLNQTGEYTVQVTDANTCKNFNTTSVTILPNPVVYATGDLVCFGEPAQLNAFGADTYYWSGPGTFTASGANPLVDPTINVQVWTYTVTGTAVNGCTAVSTATIGTRVLPVPTLTVTERACVNAYVYLNGNSSGGGALNYYWTGPLNFSSSQQNTWLMASNTGYTGNYSLMVTDAYGCKGYTSTPVIIDPEPSGQIVGKSSGCVPYCSTYSLLSSTGGQLNNALWSFNNQTQSSQMVNYCFNVPGNFELFASFEDAQTSCKGAVTRIIEVFPLPIADFVYSPVKPIENQDPVMFSNTSEGQFQTNWQWVFNDGKNTTHELENTSYMFDDAGQYAVVLMVQNTWGCLDTVVKKVEVLLDFNVYIPNAFTPNGDGLNDVFFPVLRGVKRYEMQIYDRWGALIFATSDPERNWDGTLKGEPCPIAVYTYKLVLLNTIGEEKEFTGTVNLIR